MWDLTVDGDHDFYVLAGNTSVLVHNASCPVHGHAPGDNGKAGKGKHEKGNERRQKDQGRSNNPNKRKPVCTNQPHCPK